MTGSGNSDKTVDKIPYFPGGGATVAGKVWRTNFYLTMGALK
jgi:hypothetical protein